MPNDTIASPPINCTWIKTSDRMPPVGVAVKCLLRHCSTRNTQEHQLVRVDEDDCAWRTAGDRCEISYEWDVVEWLETNEKPAQGA